MFTCSLNFTCPVPECKNNKDWYVMPLRERTKSKDFINSLNNYEVQCKKCGQRYLLNFTIQLWDIKKK